MKSKIRRACWLHAAVALAVAASAPACHEHGPDSPDGVDAIFFDDASDEVLLTLIDAADRGLVTVDDDRAPILISPTNEAVLNPAEAAVFSWEPAAVQVYHGQSTGEFVWLRVDCEQLELPIDVLAIDTATWQPNSAYWEKISLGGVCTATITGAFVDRGVIAEGGPFRPSQATAFSVAEDTD